MGDKISVSIWEDDLDFRQYYKVRKHEIAQTKPVSSSTVIEEAFDVPKKQLHKWEKVINEFEQVQNEIKQLMDDRDKANRKEYERKVRSGEYPKFEMKLCPNAKYSDYLEYGGGGKHG